ncbi:sugar ABC transporter permease [Paenibacillus qinlingensis]|uniref:Multiple sugar transport system permease protein/sn-glycerol 3-phosphate transport system permease protein n=1 Tax=Paenibacillus qinlingensis TaxID=1837343 RepID=A0ABU1NVX6_9BACL|nr:sugar ABC transporter permease [Paenibacillus qinlingensis]MDR6551625.1 multiple sugar transport system permease protein/sn-glycerol 3-phosphate transport system permease protein [Paenibacillus qinlingensis]
MTLEKWKNNLAGYLFLAPSLLVLIVFVMIPIFYSAGLSFFSWDMLRPNPTFVGLDNYERMFMNDEFYHSLKLTFLFAFITVPGSLGIALFFALLLDRGSKKLIVLIRSMFFMPMVTSTVAISVVWMFIFHPDYGLMNQFLGWFGVEPLSWLNDTKTSLLSISIMSIWKNIGYCVIIFLAGLQSIDGQVMEAAKVDGATKWQTVFKIKLPLLTPSIFLLLILQTIEQFQTFSQVDVMTQGGPAKSSELIVVQLYHYAFELFQMGYASAISMVIFGIVLLLVLLQMLLLGKKVHYQ